MLMSRIKHISLAVILAACASRPIEERLPEHIPKDLAIKLWEKIPESEKPEIIKEILYREMKSKNMSFMEYYSSLLKGYLHEQYHLGLEH